ncbi:CGNR zinc finger domain-containing protein [Sinosporangium siamense]|uniref:Zinc finger CGNR domain-containing protein n=1 Tax=Sinosporangium siamense TaxID=1367973 RepID=A0A919RLU7_9ACTN|nr:ABATE domain-containing protein [Sinosporangium siamense]GII94511.1 hypothetical protein Ssi02_47420 [Sinosporangium siamense]
MSIALEFVSTVRADSSGLVDTLADSDGLARWVLEHAAEAAVDRVDVTEFVRLEVVELRRAVRALFARAVAPAPPSSADADSLPPAREALALVNEAALAAPWARQLDWPAEGRPERRTVAAGRPGAGVRLRAVLATAAIDFLTGPDLAELRACQAPRCVLYFVKEHHRQEWCSVACGNRARAARHYRQHRSSRKAQ